MIDVKELRIGNYVLYNDKIEVIRAIRDRVVQLDYLGGNWLNCKNIHSIEVTNEILELCEFEYTSPEYKYNDVRLNRCRFNTNEFYRPNDNYIWEFDNLHDLQNMLYFMFDKMEIEYKPKEKPSLEIGDVFYVPIDFNVNGNVIHGIMKNKYYKYIGINKNNYYEAEMMDIRNGKIHWIKSYYFTENQIKELIK